MRATVGALRPFAPPARRRGGRVGRSTAALALALTGALAGGAIAAGSCDRCNVVLVTFDALRADRLGAYGYQKPTSPVLDAFARRSTVFQDCLSQSATTVNAVPAILTGRYPVTDGLLHELVLRPNVDTIATVLRRAGYHTVAVIGHTFAGCKYSGCRDVDVVSDATPASEPTPKTVARALRLLEAEVREPFFFWVHLRVPHAPYEATPAQFAVMYDGPPGPTLLSRQGPGERFFQTIARVRDHFAAAGEPVATTRVMSGRPVETTPTVLRQLAALYDANVRLGDTGFGRLLAHLKRRQLLRRTVVVVASDHGEAMGEHGVFGHNGLWHGMLHVPLVVHVPGARGRRSDAPVMNVDILPTVARLVGAPLGQPVRGGDLFGQMDPDRVRLAEYLDHYVVVRRRRKLRVRVGPRDRLRPAAPGAERGTGRPTVTSERQLRADGLWDLSTDPQEATDLGAEQPALAAELLRLGEGVRQSRLGSEPCPPAEDIFDRLRALGYVEGNPASDR
jgi:arylsulfatase